MSRPLFIHSPRYSVAIGDHVFPTRKFALVAELLKGQGDFIEPTAPSREDLLLVHTAEWTDKVLSGRLSLDEEMRLELPFNLDVAQAHLLSVGGTFLACQMALARGVGLHVGGGAHHAFADHGEGFCVLNDLACAIRRLMREEAIERAAVVDLDVHQGNGTAAIFRDDPAVFTFSIHQGDAYPTPKQGSSLDVELEVGAGDGRYLAALEKHLPAVLAFRPQLIVYQAGVDAAEGDLLGGLKLSPEGLRRRDELVREACESARLPVAVTLGGGYGPDLSATARLHAQTLKIFAALTGKGAGSPAPPHVAAPGTAERRSG